MLSVNYDSVASSLSTGFIIHLWTRNALWVETKQCIKIYDHISNQRSQVGKWRPLTNCINSREACYLWIVCEFSTNRFYQTATNRYVCFNWKPFFPRQKQIKNHQIIKEKKKRNNKVHWQSKGGKGKAFGRAFNKGN